MPVDFSGTWNLTSSDNFEGYMLALEMDLLNRLLDQLSGSSLLLSGSQRIGLMAKSVKAYPVSVGIDFATRKIAKMLKPQKVIKQEGDSFSIHTASTFRSYFVQFKIGEEFEEDNKGLDHRKCKSVVTWDNDKLVCVQTGDKKNRGWTHWIEGEELYLEICCEDQVCKQVYKRA